MSRVRNLTGIVTATLLLCSCATTGARHGEPQSPITKYISAPLTYAIVSRLHKPIYSASVHRTDDGQDIVWSNVLTGGPKYSGPDFENASIMDEGTYANWNWSIHGPRDVERSSRMWIQASADQPERDAIVHDWQSGMQLLYRLSAYLLGESPRAIDAHVMLVPKGQAYEMARRQPIASITQLDFAGAYSVSHRTTRAAQAERFDDVRVALARLGGMLQHLELATGVGAAPTDEPARSIKDAANSFCWNVSVRPALAAYTDAKIPGVETSSSTVELGAAMYAQHPESQLALVAYALLLDVAGADSYLRHRGLDWPETGRDIEGINGLLEYCRALIQYSGDITREPLSVDLIPSAPFFTHKVDVGQPSSTLDRLE